MATATKPMDRATLAREIADGLWAGEIEGAAFSADNQAAPFDVAESIFSHLASPLVDSASATLERGGGSAWEPLRPVPARALWTDLRPSQAERLMRIVEAAQERATTRCRQVMVDEVRTATATFVAEFPAELETVS